MAIELNRETRQQAIASIERYFAEELDQMVDKLRSQIAAAKKAAEKPASAAPAKK